MTHTYLDNAATTPLRDEVITEMTAILQKTYGNPSSIYSLGRNAKAIIETSRKKIAELLNAFSQEIIFTSSATEANNWILINAVKNLGINRIITSKIEHHSVLNTALKLQNKHKIELIFVDLHKNGAINLDHLENILKDEKPTLVSLMYVNNEIGNILDIEKTGSLCQKYKAYFHSDTVQAMGKIRMNLHELPVDFIVGTAHKFHGPKGIGFLFVRKGISLKPLFFGGNQEKGIRAGTESTHQIVGLAKALEFSYRNLDLEKEPIFSLKKYLIKQLDQSFSGYKINGDTENGIHTIINVQFPLLSKDDALILFDLDLKNIFVSRGSACQSGSVSTSHVLKEILPENELKNLSLRISFSHYNTKEDVDRLIEVLKKI